MFFTHGAEFARIEKRSGMWLRGEFGHGNAWPHRGVASREHSWGKNAPAAFLALHQKIVAQNFLWVQVKSRPTSHPLDNLSYSHHPLAICVEVSMARCNLRRFDFRYFRNFQKPLSDPRKITN
ncbi:MAG: hypothetical protein KDJ67_01110 [Nitratireductor sp.]|nr:hypothetical protein [Nitratireductor sp.]